MNTYLIILMGIVIFGISNCKTVANLIRNDKIDILGCRLSGHTVFDYSGNRLKLEKLMHKRPSPIQVTWLGIFQELNMLEKC